MDDLISRQLVIKTLCERRCGNKSKGCPSGFCTESLAVDCIPSAQPGPIRLNIDHALTEEEIKNLKQKIADSPIVLMPSAQPDYTELKREFILMASYIDVLLECSDEQKETLNGFISRLSEYMPWTERRQK